MVNTSPSNAGGVGSIPGQKADSTCLAAKKTKTENRSNVVTNSIRALKMVHIKKKRIKTQVTCNTTQRKLSSMPYLSHPLRHVSKMGDKCTIKSHY